MYEMCCLESCPPRPYKNTLATSAIQPLPRFDLKTVTSVQQASKNADAVFGAFFRNHEIEAICKREKLVFQNRYLLNMNNY
jgi:hypothetical protein